MGLADCQHGVASHAQLLVLALSPAAIGRRLGLGRLHPVHRGVYAVGRPDLTRKGRWMAAVLAGGEGAVLSHRAAGALWEILTWRGRPDVTTPGSLRSRPDLAFHTASLRSDEVTRVDGIPVTTVPRTLLDLAAVLPRDRLARAVNEGEVRRLGGPVDTQALIARHPGRRGARNLRGVLADLDVGGSVTREELEQRFLAFIRSSALPPAEHNAAVRVGARWFVVDCLWRSHRLAIELDGWQAHGTHRAFHQDRARDRLLTAAGWRTGRVTWRDLDDDPAGLEAELLGMLAADGGPGHRDRT